ncbi:MAG TPA: hypothetical protein VML91_25400, partial [Burkholderiales bacterium]|nr:hypothetical protein [Burkholderiales bacterium]
MTKINTSLLTWAQVVCAQDAGDCAEAVGRTQSEEIDMGPTNEQLIWMYETMLLVREYEETMAKVYLEG